MLKKINKHSTEWEKIFAQHTSAKGQYIRPTKRKEKEKKSNVKMGEDKQKLLQRENKKDGK